MTITHFEAETDIGGRVSRMRLPLYRPLDIAGPIDPASVMCAECHDAEPRYGFPARVLATYVSYVSEDGDHEHKFFAVEADDIDDAYRLAIEILSAARYARRKKGEG